MHLSLATQDERAGLPSASEYDRLLACRTSYLLSRRAHALGQVAHQQSPAADLGTKKHLASIEGPEGLSEAERQDWEKCQRKREEFIKGWLGNSQEPLSSIKEERVWLRRGIIRPLLTGKPDEILKAGNRVAVLDQKFGSYRVSDPAENVQLSIYALLVSRDDDAIEEVTVQVLSPYFDFKPFTYTRADLDRIHQSVLVVINSLGDPGEPVPGAHCQFCPARLICPSARNEAENATLAKVIELPVGEPAATLWTQIKRAQALFKEIESHYKRLLEREAGAIPGWGLVPGNVIRSVENPVKVYALLAELLSPQDFLSCCSVSVPELERSWARKKGVPASQTKELFKKFLGDLLVEKRNAPSLKPI
jgi:hypothetical protein